MNFDGVGQEATDSQMLAVDDSQVQVPVPARRTAYERCTQTCTEAELRSEGGSVDGSRCKPIRASENRATENRATEGTNDGVHVARVGMRDKVGPQ